MIYEVKEDFEENEEFGLSIWKLGRVWIIEKERRGNFSRLEIKKSWGKKRRGK